MPAGHRLRGEDEAAGVLSAHRPVPALFLIGALFLMEREPAGGPSCWPPDSCSLRTWAAPATSARSLARAASAGMRRRPPAGVCYRRPAGAESRGRREGGATRAGG